MQQEQLAMMAQQQAQMAQEQSPEGQQWTFQEHYSKTESRKWSLKMRNISSKT
jgi:hypothetical protein